MRNTPQSLLRLTHTIAWMVSAAIALLAPTAYYFVSYHNIRSVMGAQTELRALDVSRVVHANPVMWRFEEVRLSELLERRSTDNTDETIRITDAHGKVIAQNSVDTLPPRTRLTHRIYDAGADIAHIEVSRSLRPLLSMTLLVAIASAAFAYIVFLALRTLPRRALENAFRALSESESKYRSLYETMREGMALHRFTRDADGIRTSLSLVDANPSCLSILGVDRHRVIGSDSLALFGDSFRRHFPELVKVADDKAYVSFELLMPGSRHYVVHAFSPEEDHVATLLEDITDRKRAEEERLALERQLLQSQKLESLGVLSGGIAHDFNNLLHALLGNLDLALMKYRGGDDDARRHIDQAVTAGKQAAKLTDMILAYTGKKPSEVRKVNVSALVEKSASMLGAITSRNVAFDLTLDRDIPPVMADEGQLQQVIMNLITNASEAIGESVGRVRVSTGVRQYDQAALNASRLEEKLPAGRYVFLEVSDNGCGMDTVTLQKLFDPFFTTKFAGRGLGMSAVLGILRAHQGAFLVESAPGAGTTVQVLLPMAPVTETGETVSEPAVRDPRADTRMHPAQVLIVDDEEMVRQVVAAMLNELGVRTIAAADGEEALRVVRAQGDSIDLVILDQNMPLMDGATVFRELKKIRPDIKVLLASGYSEADVASRFNGLGLAGIIQKPYDIQVLSDGLRRALHG